MQSRFSTFFLKINLKKKQLLVENVRKGFYNFPMSHRCENGLQEITRVDPIPISDIRFCKDYWPQKMC